MKNKEYVSIKKMNEYIDKALRYTQNCNFPPSLRPFVCMPKSYFNSEYSFVNEI